MGQLTHVTGDLIASDELVIAHGCNAKGVMGAGFAKHIRNLYPEVYSRYRHSVIDGEFVGGTAQRCTTVTTVGQSGSVREVFNLCTQIEPGPNGSYWLITLAFGSMFEQCVQRGIKRVGIPRIGCDIAALDWDTVEFIIEGIYQWQPEGPDVVVYTLPSDIHKWR